MAMLARGESSEGVLRESLGNLRDQIKNVLSDKSGSVPALLGLPTDPAEFVAGLDRELKAVTEAVEARLASNAAACLASRVHPRGCGGARPGGGVNLGTRGPSPRVRGSLDMEIRGFASEGSIPAGAGEPVLLSRLHDQTKVHPRGCGGALEEPLPRRTDRGSIPAGAGEPEAGSDPILHYGVQPRGCGGAERVGSRG